MITKLIFKSKNKQDIEVQEGICTINTQSQSSLVAFQPHNSGIAFGFKQEVLKGLFNRILPTLSTQKKTSNNFLTINGIIPDQRNGAFYILGSECLSIGDFTDTSDPDITVPNTTTLTVFDGCIPCNFCTKLAQLKRDLRQCQIYLNYLKDCNLYYKAQADNRLQASIEAGLDKTEGCDTKPLDYSQLEPAIKLLYQYKAAVMMWNYLVSITRGNLQILQAVEDWGGFIVQSKRSADLCAVNSGIAVTFQVFIKLQDGQTAEYLQSLNCGMGFYVDVVPQNTYIQYGKDSGMHNIQNFDSNYINTTIQVPDVYNEGQIHAKIIFTTSRSAVTVFAASIKILPVIYLKDYKYYNTDPQTGEKTSVRLQTPSQSPILIQDIMQWNKYRMQAQSLSDSSYIALNNWQIATRWDLSNIQASTKVDETVYYQTAYLRHAQPQSDSIQQNTGEQT